MRILIALATVLLVSGSAHAARQSDAPAVTYIAGNLLGVDLETPATLDFDTPGFARGGFGTGKGVRVEIGRAHV